MIIAFMKKDWGVRIVRAFGEGRVYFVYRF